VIRVVNDFQKSSTKVERSPEKIDFKVGFHYQDNFFLKIYMIYYCCFFLTVFSLPILYTQFFGCSYKNHHIFTSFFGTSTGRQRRHHRWTENLPNFKRLFYCIYLPFTILQIKLLTPPIHGKNCLYAVLYYSVICFVCMHVQQRRRVNLKKTIKA